MTGVILFRAQPFHNGHLAQIKRAYEDMRKLNGELYVIVGSADKLGTKRNPIPITVRIDLIHGSLKDVYDSSDLSHIHVVPLEDYSDEANNTHTWGDYLYQHMCVITRDTDFIFYYSDKPEIALSWFHDCLREYLYFKFLPRIKNINATFVRDCLINIPNDNNILLAEYLPPYVLSKRDELREYIINAR